MRANRDILALDLCAWMNEASFSYMEEEGYEEMAVYPFNRKRYDTNSLMFRDVLLLDKSSLSNDATRKGWNALNRKAYRHATLADEAKEIEILTLAEMVEEYQ